MAKEKEEEEVNAKGQRLKGAKNFFYKEIIELLEKRVAAIKSPPPFPPCALCKNSLRL
jgi:hypothetical protein